MNSSGSRARLPGQRAAGLPSVRPKEPARLAPRRSTLRTANTTTAAAPGRLGLPFFVFCVYTFILIGRPQDYVPALLPLRPALMFTLLTVLVTLFSARGNEGGESLFRQTETRLYFLLFGVMCAGIPFAIHRGVSFDAILLKYIVNIAFFVLFVVHVDSMAKLKRIGIVLVLSGFIFTVLGLRHGQFDQGRFTVSGDMYDPNDIAFVEISLFAFAVWVSIGSFGKIMKAVALAGILFGTLLTLYTASRGGLLGLVSFFLLFLWLRVPQVKKSFKAILCIALVAVAVLNADKINVERYLTLGAIENDYNFGEFGRTDIWERGVNLFLADPITGVGVGNFGMAIGAMRAEENRLPRWQAAHSAYLQILTETGLFGAVAFVLLVGACIRTLNGLRRRGYTLAEDKDLAILPGLLLIGFIAQLISALFLSQAYSMFFTLLFAASSALKRLAATAQTSIVSNTRSPDRFL